MHGLIDSSLSNNHSSSFSGRSIMASALSRTFSSTPLILRAGSGRQGRSDRFCRTVHRQTLDAGGRLATTASGRSEASSLLRILLRRLTKTPLLESCGGISFPPTIYAIFNNSVSMVDRCALGQAVAGHAPYVLHPLRHCRELHALINGRSPVDGARRDYTAERIDSYHVPWKQDHRKVFSASISENLASTYGQCGSLWAFSFP